MASALESYILTLDQWGVVDVLAPFLLIFVVVFAILQKAKIFGDEEEGRKFNGVIAVIMALAVVVPHVLYKRPNSAVNIINRFLPQISLFVVVAVMLLLVLGVFDVRIGNTNLSGIATLISLIAVVLIFLNSAGIYGLPNFLYFLSDPQVQFLVITILIFGVAIWFITSPAKKDKHKENNKNVLEKLDDTFLKNDGGH